MRLACLDVLVHPVPLEYLVSLVGKEHKDFRVLLDHRGEREQSVQSVHRDEMGTQDFLEHLVVMARLDLLVQLDSGVLPVYRERKVSRVALVKVVFQVLLVQMAYLVEWDALVRPAYPDHQDATVSMVCQVGMVPLVFPVFQEPRVEWVELAPMVYPVEME